MTTPFAFAKVVATLGDIYPRQVPRQFHLIYKQLIREFKTFSNGKKGLFCCRCPRRLAYSTVDSYIGKLRSIFAEAGRERDWNRTLLLGNPATEDLV